jgi:hypothetical protein
MNRLRIAYLMSAALLAACTQTPPQPNAPVKYCNVQTHELCLDQQRTHDCQPCPNPQ